MTKTYKIAVIPGDGIGTEVMPEALRVLDAATKRLASQSNISILNGRAVRTTRSTAR